MVAVTHSFPNANHMLSKLGILGAMFLHDKKMIVKDGHDTNKKMGLFAV